MCGIGGVLRTDGEGIPEAWLDAIDARVAWRGPDGKGRFRDRVEWTDEATGEARAVEVALVHRRLAIIDLEGGEQPMVSERGRDAGEGLVAVVFNGCVYNHRELRAGLEAAGREFATDHSDTEVLIHGWREWGEGLFERLEGMYAFGLWDRAKRTLVLGRDAFGEKPLYSCEWGAALDGSGGAGPSVAAFASTSEALGFAHDELGSPGKTGAERVLRGVLRLGYPPRPDTMTRGVSEVSPAARGRCGPEGVRWTEGGRPTLAALGGRAGASAPPGPEEIEAALDRAVARRLISDVPLGCFLSGGVDSSLVSHFAKRHKPDVKTFSVRMPDARYDESAHAEAVARHLGTDHATLEVSMRPAEDLVRLIELLGQPFGDSSILPTYWVSKAAREHVKVALSGDGGDELFLGYERYLAAPLLARHWRWLRRLPAGALHRAHPKSRLNKLARLVDMARDFPRVGVAAMESVFTLDRIEALRPRMAREPVPTADGPEEASDGLGVWPSRKPQGDARRALRELRDFDLDWYLPGDLLRKVDTASMAVGLEVRAPFLDRDLAAAALATPIERLLKGGRKGMLREIARKHLPREAVDRPKMGFAIPIGEWFRTDFGGMKTLLMDVVGSREPFGPVELDMDVVRRLVREHLEGRRDHGPRLFLLTTLGIWGRMATGARGASAGTTGGPTPSQR